VKRLLVILAVLCLSGCGNTVYETVADVPVLEVSAPCQQIMLNLPPEAAILAGADDTNGKIYDCNGFTLSVQTLPSGDLNKTFLTITGYPKDELQVIESVKGDDKRYDCVFTTVGEDGLYVGRTCILDDGSYHYALSTVAPEATSGTFTNPWRDIYTSFQIVDADWDINTGS